MKKQIVKEFFEGLSQPAWEQMVQVQEWSACMSSKPPVHFRFIRNVFGVHLGKSVSVSSTSSVPFSPHLCLRFFEDFISVALFCCFFSRHSDSNSGKRNFWMFNGIHKKEKNEKKKKKTASVGDQVAMQRDCKICKEVLESVRTLYRL